MAEDIDIDIVQDQDQDLVQEIDVEGQGRQINPVQKMLEVEVEVVV